MTAATGLCRNGFYFGYQSVLVVSAIVVVLAVTIDCATTPVSEYYENDMTGPFCAKINQCCDNRKDECSVQLNGTKCYCDKFCDRRPNGSDCCPDYWSHCRITPGQLYQNSSEQAYYDPGVEKTVYCNSGNQDDLELFFKCIGQTIRKFPQQFIVETKLRIFQIVSQTERTLVNTTCEVRTIK